MNSHSDKIVCPPSIVEMEKEYNELKEKMYELSQKYDQAIIDEEWKQLGDYMKGKWIVTREGEIYYCEGTSPAQSWDIRNRMERGNFDALGRIWIKGVKIFWDKEKNGIEHDNFDGFVVVNWRQFLVDTNYVKKTIERCIRQYNRAYSYSFEVGDTKISIMHNVEINIEEI